MKEYLFREYELNEKYHDSKENRAWIACALYFTYSLLLLKWILSSNSQCIIKENVYFLIAILSLIDFSSFLFVFFQIKRKAHSVMKAAILKYAIANQYTANDKNVWSTVVWNNEIATQENLSGYWPGWLKVYKIELALFFLIFLFFIAKLYFILTISSPTLASIIAMSCLQLVMYLSLAFIFGLFLGLTLCCAINGKKKKHNKK